jgi:hypothetical protein
LIVTTMKKLTPLLALSAAALLHPGVDAATVMPGDPADGGILYRWMIDLNMIDSATIVRHVGAWSWEDESLFNTATQNPVGWTHNSDWVALTLANPLRLTIRVESKEGVPNPTSQDPNALAGTNLYPGLTLYRGWDNDGDDSHSYSNRGNVSWAEDVTYIAHVEPHGSHSVEQTWNLPAGLYTMVLGGNSISTVNEGRQGYQAIFTTAAVPEPGSAALLAFAASALACRRRRR